MFKVRKPVDLHVHTVCSDGLLSPAEVIALAESQGLSAVAITDHDTVEGIESALQVIGGQAIEVVPGVELSSEYSNREIHILGYWIDHKHDRLNSLLRDLRQSRFERAEKIVDKLCALGFLLDYQEVLKLAGNAAPGRLHIARAMVDRGYAESIRTVFDKWLAFRRPAYVERFKLSPQEAIAAIGSAGGIAVLAHPGLTGNISLLDTFIKWGIEGLEVYHPDHSITQTLQFRILALRRNLCITGGSDFHGPETGRTQRLGSCGVTINELQQLKAGKKK
jgi:predicted metal-dependent phosphoesterase TrpH